MKKPDWAPDEPNDAFTSFIMEESKTPIIPLAIKKKKVVSVQEMVEGITSGNRTMLGQAITLVESNAKKHGEKAQEVLQGIMLLTGKSIRIGISGVPGAGKSTFIEAFGLMLCEKGHKVAVLAVDPSSTVTGGSILGDKTRMEKLVQHLGAFVRPSPSGGTLGGVHRRTQESILLCEAAGYDVVLVETVGVGQSEAIVREMVDFFLLLALTGAGDEIQGMKRGILEMVDGIAVNKADGENKERAMVTVSQYKQMVDLFQPVTEGWKTVVFPCSSLYGDGIKECWETIDTFHKMTTANHFFEERRSRQKRNWMYRGIEEELKKHFFQHPSMQEKLSVMEESVVKGVVPVTNATEMLLEVYFDIIKK